MSCPESATRSSLLSTQAFFWKWTLFGLAISGLAACAEPEPSPVVEFEYAGCLYVELPLDDPVCVLDEQEPNMKLWVRVSENLPVTLQAGDQIWDSAEARSIQGGFLFELEDPSASELSIHTGPQPSPSLKTLRLSKASSLDLHDKTVEELRALVGSEPPPAELGEVFLALARAVRRTGDSEAGASNYDDAARAFERAGRRSAAIGALAARHFVLYDSLNRPREAGEVLASLPEAPAGDGESKFFVSFYQGSWANRSGRFRTALRRLEGAGRRFERLDLSPDLGNMVQQERAHLLSRLGRHSEAEAVNQRLEAYASTLDPDAAARTLAEVWTNVGWSRYLMAETGRQIDPIPALSRALPAAESSGLVELIKNAELNLALAFLQVDQPEKAREHWARVPELDADTDWWIKTWAIETEARLALAEGRGETALRLYSQLSEEPESRFYLDALWRAAVGRGRALADLGRWQEALDAYAEADAELRRLSVTVPLDEGRIGSAAFYRRGALQHLELLVRLDRRKEALDLARRSRTHVFRGLVMESRLGALSPDEKAEWDLLVEKYRELQDQIRASFEEAELAAGDRVESLQETRVRLERRLRPLLDEALSMLDERTEDLTLPEIHGDRLWLVFHPLPEGWLGLAVDRSGLMMSRLPSPTADLLADPAAFSVAFLEPFAEAIRRAPKIRILPSGELWGVHFQGLPWDGGILLDQAPVTYGLDLPAGGSLPASRQALLIADPSGSLIHADREIEGIERQLRSLKGPWKTRTVSSSLGVSEALGFLEQAAGLFHFAGHGDLFNDSEIATGRGGLVLQQGFEGRVALSVHDVLTLARAPATVVLSGCDTLRSSSAESSSGLGVGHAFLLAGSHSAVGAVERVDDRQAESLIRLFYQYWDGPGSEAEALRRAQLELHRGSISGWSAFRVLER